MTFIVGHDKLLERPIRDVARIVSHLYTTKDFDRLSRLRRMLVKEQLETVDTFDLPSDRIEQLKARVRGVQWQLDMEMKRAGDDDERLALLAAGFWKGCEVLTAVKDRNMGTSGYPPRED